MFVNIDKDITLLLMAGQHNTCIKLLVFTYLVPQQKWNTYLETTQKLGKGNIANFCFQDRS